MRASLFSTAMMERPLGIFETAETMTAAYASFNVVGVIQFDTGIGTNELRSALDRVQERHPLLRARIIEDAGTYRYDFQVSSEIPLEIIEREDDDHWRTVAAAELDRTFDIGAGPLMRCTLLVGPPGTVACELIVCILHTIVDGNSALSLVHEILEAWDARAAGRKLDAPEVLSLQPPVETLFPPKFRGFRAKMGLAGFMARQMADEIGYRRRARRTRRMPIHGPSRCRVLSRDLPASDVEPLVRATRRHRVTLNSALNAAMLVVLQRQLYDGAAVPLRNFNFGILRPYLQPPVANHHLGSFHVMLRSTVTLETGQDAWGLASRINSQFLAAARRGEKYLSLLAVDRVMRFMLSQRKMRMAAAALAYTGPPKLPAEIGAIRIRGVRAMVTNFDLGPEYTVQSRLWQGRLLWDQVYLDGDMDEARAAEITDDILDLLSTMGREPR